MSNEDYGDLPQALLSQLGKQRKLRATKRDVVQRIMDLHKGKANLDEILVGFYRLKGEILLRGSLKGYLYSLKQQSYIELDSDGYYHPLEKLVKSGFMGEYK